MKRIFGILLTLINLLTVAQVNSSVIKRDDKTIMDKLVQNWFDCYNKWDLDKLKTLYSENIIYYGKNLSKEQCINEKVKFFNPKTTFTQKLISDVSYEKNKNGIIIARFIKRAGKRLQ